MRPILLAVAAAACTPVPQGPDPGPPPSGPPGVGSASTTEQTEPRPPGGTVATDCDPDLDQVDATALTAADLPLDPLGRTLTVALSSTAGAVVTCDLIESPSRLLEVVPADATWRYLDDGSDPGTAFVDPAFDDTAWPLGQAPFHREQVGTTVLGDTAAPPAAFFRTTFEVDDLDSVVSLRAAVRYDDGVIVWVNGAEAIHLNVPVVSLVTGEIELELMPQEVDPSLLVAGTNTIAVELVEGDGSTDSAFGFRLALELDDLLPESHVLVSDSPAETHTFALHGLLADAAYDCAARSNACDGAEASTEIRTAPLPVTVPPMALRAGVETPAWGAYTLFNHQRPCVEEHSNRLFIVDPEGRVRWWHELPIDATSSIDIEAAWQPDGTIVWGGGADPNGIPQDVALDGTVPWAASYPGIEADIYHHDIEVLPNGHVLAFVNDTVQTAALPLEGIGLVEYDPATHEITWRWTSQQAYDLGELSAGSPDHPDDPWHPNSLAWVSDADGEGVFVSNLYANEIIRIDKATGHVLYRLGTGGDWAVNGTWFDHLHAISLVDGRLYVYDNGWTNGQSRALGFDLDVATRTATLAFEYTEPNWYEADWGDVDPIGDGYALVNMAHAVCRGARHDHHGSFLDVNQDTDEVVWRVDLLDPSDSSYRSQRLDGCIFANTRYCAP